jgi:hypothetical protein
MMPMASLEDAFRRIEHCPVAVVVGRLQLVLRGEGLGVADAVAKRALINAMGEHQ